MGVGNFQARWIGWPGVYVEDGPDRTALTDALAAENYIPVYLDANIVRPGPRTRLRPRPPQKHTVTYMAAASDTASPS